MNFWFTINIDNITTHTMSYNFCNAVGIIIVKKSMYIDFCLAFCLNLLRLDDEMLGFPEFSFNLTVLFCRV